MKDFIDRCCIILGLIVFIILGLKLIFYIDETLTMAIEQLEFFPQTEDEKNRKRIEEVFTRLENVRRGIYRRHNELAKLFMDQNERLERIEKYICKTKEASNDEFKFE